jgi:hypothetical protein
VHAGAAAPPVEKEPMGHWAVHAGVVSPVDAPYVPAGQAGQAAAPPVE